MTRPPQPFRFRWEQTLRSDPSTGGTLMLVLLTLATYADADGTRMLASQATLATGAGLGVSTVRKHLRAAVDAGWLTVVSRGHRTWDGKGVPSEYSLSIPQGGSVQPPVGERLGGESTARPVAVEADSTARSKPLNRSIRPPQLLANEHLPERPGGPVKRAYPKQCDQHQAAVNQQDCRGCMRARQAFEDDTAKRRSRDESEPRCEEHEFYPADNCGPCRSEIITRMRPPEFMGRVFTRPMSTEDHERIAQ